jgi:N-acyl-D-aspartate/D-glutamate deacylase
MAQKKILISGARVADGTGREPVSLDILIEGDRITDLSDRIDGSYQELFDASGLIAAPGFIDIHTHGDMDMYPMPSSRTERYGKRS